MMSDETFFCGAEGGKRWFFFGGNMIGVVRNISAECKGIRVSLAICCVTLASILSQSSRYLEGAEFFSRAEEGGKGGVDLYRSIALLVSQCVNSSATLA